MKRTRGSNDEPQRQPWMKFYCADWRSNIELRACSYGARGLWMEMLCLMHESQPRGSLLLNGRQITAAQLAVLAGGALKDTQTLLGELEDAAVFSRDTDGTIYSRRMRRDIERAARDKANGSGGGNPNLRNGSTRGLTPTPTQTSNRRVNRNDNGEDKAQKPEARVYPSQTRNLPRNIHNLGDSTGVGIHTPCASEHTPGNGLDPGWDDSEPFSPEVRQ